MAKLQLKAKEIRALGYDEGPVVSIAMQVMEKHYKHASKEVALDILKSVLQSPNDFAANDVLCKIANELIEEQPVPRFEEVLREAGIPYNVFGVSFIEELAIKQMNGAMQLPVAVAGALMPDAHAGYGLPIGGVLATDNAVIPYGVGVDIGCRMCLSIFDIDVKELTQKQQFFTKALHESTLFGAGREFEQGGEHEVLDSPAFKDIALLRQLQSKAARQLGSSGSGNHFVEFGEVVIEEADSVLAVPPGKYLALLSHSGSRGMGATIATHYTQLAREKRLLPSSAQNLAWFTLNEEEGIEYWIAMNLAGDYAKACHDVIHAKLARQLGRKPLRTVENHHNFAWKEMHEGREVVVHRKGATPAGKDVLGIIPGSVTAPGFIVKGLGQQAAICSASHGAGRKMSRSVAMESITQHALNAELQKHGVKLLGGGLDEAPFAYKNIEDVMNAQKQLVTAVGRFYPRIVKMDGGTARQWKKSNRKTPGFE
ncbi:tRNA-splicing ligase RtcB [Filimonas zeae]|uniref:3'-phosphate/5'-hydroxy nucleic acid ligase n=1 Tax=Filimonas zeae TaxID=1737353 RepID=A0A917J207_9BACT|nr:RtcB family protein [Filimonas zeae]MDR6340990.1 tRNA-splicing ligase RtcB [Filimonas zeae]GGH77662.1 RNA-splicing ligase RtcB [Filimonas zeae]